MGQTCVLVEWWLHKSTQVVSWQTHIFPVSISSFWYCTKQPLNEIWTSPYIVLPLPMTIIIWKTILAHAYIPNYSEGRDQENSGLKPSQANSSWNSISKKKPSPKKKRTGRVAQDVGPNSNLSTAKIFLHKFCYSMSLQETNIGTKSRCLWSNCLQCTSLNSKAPQNGTKVFTASFSEEQCIPGTWEV
jgi:hypothetical protein